MHNKITNPKIKHRSFSIKTKVALLCTFCILSAVFMNYFLVLSTSKNTITTNTGNNILDLTVAYKENVSNTINQIKESANYMMNSNAVSSYLSSGGTVNEDEVNNFITMFTNMHPESEEINLADSNGTILLSSNKANIGKDISNETYFTDVINTNKSSQSDVFTSDVSNEAVITFAIPIKWGGGIGLNSDIQIENGHIMTPNQTNLDSNKGLINNSDTVNPTNDMNSGTHNSNIIPIPDDFSGTITINILASSLGSAIQDISVSNSDSSYAFLLDTSGTVIYHPSTKLIGTKLNIAKLNTIIANNETGLILEPNTLEYTYEGIEKIAGYTIDQSTNWMLVISADKHEILSSLKELTKLSIIFSLFIVGGLTLFAYFFAETISSPIKTVTKLINKTADLDLTIDTSYTQLLERNDETGEMCRSIERMQKSLNTMVLHIDSTSKNINTSNDSLNTYMNFINEHTSDNSATTEELSASMEETASTTEVMHMNIQKMKINTQDMFENATSGELISNTLMDKASQLKTTTLNATNETKRIYDEVKSNTDTAILKSKNVEKINILTNTIKDIADQTSLLSLNASIEAARAGDAGRGFSVVASEIGTLAVQSSKTVHQINEIVTVIHEAVNNITNSLLQTLTFLEEKVLVDYSNFVDVSEEYANDSLTMNQTIKSIHRQIKDTNEAMVTIGNSITEINTMMNETSVGVSDVAEKNANIVLLSTKTNDIVYENTQNTLKLKEIIDKFKL